MVAITRAYAAPAPVGERPGRSSPELDANLRTCRAQMMDWVTCPSAKTPEGKAKIAQISSKLDSIRQEIKQADGSAPDSRTAVSSPPSTAQSPPVTYLGVSTRVGANVDTYA